MRDKWTRGAAQSWACIQLKRHICCCKCFTGTCANSLCLPLAYSMFSSFFYFTLFSSLLPHSQNHRHWHYCICTSVQNKGIGGWKWVMVWSMLAERHKPGTGLTALHIYSKSKSCVFAKLWDPEGTQQRLTKAADFWHILTVNHHVNKMEWQERQKRRGGCSWPDV